MYGRLKYKKTMNEIKTINKIIYIRKKKFDKFLK